jgi:hypothetical protein
MFSVEHLIVASFATWGITFGLVHRNGAFGVMRKVREWANQYAWSPLWCVYCTGFWVALLFSLFSAHSLFELFVYWFGAAGGNFVIESVVDRLIRDSEEVV